MKDLYGGTGVQYTFDAKKDLERISQLRLVNEPVCVAKTPLSLSDDPMKLGRPREFPVLVRRLKVAAGAGFNIAYMGDMVTMLGLSKHLVVRIKEQVHRPLQKIYGLPDPEGGRACT